MIPYNSEERARWRKRRRTIRRITVAAECLAIVAILAAGAMFIGTKIQTCCREQPECRIGKQLPPPIRPQQKKSISQTIPPKARPLPKPLLRKHRLRAFCPGPLPWLRDTIMTRPFPCFRRMHRQPPFRKSSLPLPSTNHSSVSGPDSHQPR